MSRGPSPVRSVTVTIDDVMYFGTYYVQNSIVYVQSEFGRKTAQTGGSPSRAIAKILLSELVRGA
jgi:hypothetical protein